MHKCKICQDSSKSVVCKECLVFIIIVGAILLSIYFGIMVSNSKSKTNGKTSNENSEIAQVDVNENSDDNIEETEKILKDNSISDDDGTLSEKDSNSKKTTNNDNDPKSSNYPSGNVATINGQKNISNTSNKKNNNTVNDATQSQYTITTSQKNALEKAKSYLRASAFSYSGLVNQLQYEGYSYDDSVYAVNNCGANWNEQALKKAKSYLSMMSFSRDGLINQLEFEGFTHDQAVYGVEQNGL